MGLQKLNIMITIRKGVFETNSSSTHSICIAANVDLIIPESVHFEFGEFGWEEDRLDTMSEKASYLYTGLYGTGREDDFERVIEWLTQSGIEVTRQEKTNDDIFEYGYVDHAHDLKDFLDSVLDDKDRLFRYLFSPFSFIVTGNDNSDIEVSIDVEYPYESYYKGN